MLLGRNVDGCAASRILRGEVALAPHLAHDLEPSRQTLIVANMK